MTRSRWVSCWHCIQPSALWSHRSSCSPKASFVDNEDARILQWASRQMKGGTSLDDKTVTIGELIDDWSNLIDDNAWRQYHWPIRCNVQRQKQFLDFFDIFELDWSVSIRHVWPSSTDSLPILKYNVRLNSLIGSVAMVTVHVELCSFNWPLIFRSSAIRFYNLTGSTVNAWILNFLDKIIKLKTGILRSYGNGRATSSWEYLFSVLLRNFVSSWRTKDKQRKMSKWMAFPSIK